jgi:dipeptidyl aminopeptidase/acylaminoacyl peptidase
MTDLEMTDQKGTSPVQNLSGRLSLASAGLLAACLIAGFLSPLQGAPLPPALSGLSFSPDGGKVLVSMDADGVPNAWALPLGKGEPVQLTRSAKEPVWTVSYFPADERFLYRSGPAGDEAHLFVRERDGKAVELIPGKVTRFFGWAGDGKSFFVEALNSSGPSWDLFRVAAAGYQKTRLDRNSSHVSRLAAVSGDGRYVAYSEKFSDLTRNLRLRDLTTGLSRSLKANEGFEVNIPLRFSPDGKTLLLLHDGERPFRALERLETTAGQVKELISKELVRGDWDLLDAAYSPDGKRVAVIANGDSRSSLQLYDTATWKPVVLPGLPATGEVTAVAFSRDGRSLAFVASASDSPPAVWLYDLARPGTPRRLSAGDGAGAAGVGGGWVAGEVRRFKASFDQQEIPGILYKPRAASPEHPVPAVVWVHDGPSGQATLAFDPLIQSLVGRGYAVYAVNPRGSFGYGKTFLQLDDRRHGEGDLQDCIDVKGQLAATGWVDPARIAIGGVGFGGFLALDALAFEPQTFAAGVDLFGVADWQRLINTMPYGQSERTALTEEMGHVNDLLAAQHMNPRAKAGDIVRPLLIVQGAQDTLAIPADAAEIAGRMKGNQRTVELLTLPDAAHGLVLRADREKVYAAVGDFLDANLKGSKEAKPSAGR